MRGSESLRKRLDKELKQPVLRRSAGELPRAGPKANESGTTWPT